MSPTSVGVVWIALSIFVATSYWFSLLQPYWFVDPSTMTSLGVYSYCVIDADLRRTDLTDKPDVITNTMTSSSAVATSIARLFADCLTSPLVDVEDASSSIVCRVYGGRFQLALMPSGPWQAACILFVSGAALMSFATVLAVGTLCAPRKSDSNLVAVAGYIQIVAVIMFTGGLIVFPAGFDSHFVRTMCRRAGSYWPGDCSVGWTSVLAVVADSLSAFCPFLSHHIHANRREAVSLERFQYIY